MAHRKPTRRLSHAPGASPASGGPEDRAVKLSISLPKRVLEHLKRRAREDNRTPSNFVQKLVVEDEEKMAAA